MMGGLAAISCHGLEKSFGEIRALDKVDIEVPTGITFGLIGPNGAGKTTLIRILLGLTAADEGTAVVLGEVIPPIRVLPRIGYMPQSLAVYLDLTVAENLRLYGRLAGMDRNAIESRTAEVLQLVDLTARTDDLLANLSGGMRRRASLAATLLSDPDLLLLDEPTVGIDPELRASFWSYFSNLTSQGKTVLITTHYMDEATRCDRVGLMHRGVILAQDAPMAIRHDTGTESLEDAFLSLVRSKGVSQNELR